MCHHGYLGDIITGPFVTFSLGCEDKDMLTIRNGVPAKRTAEIAERNVSRMLHEVLQQEPYVPPQ